MNVLKELLTYARGRDPGQHYDAIDARQCALTQFERRNGAYVEKTNLADYPHDIARAVVWSATWGELTDRLQAMEGQPS